MTDDPRGLADGDGTEPPALTPEEEAAVRGLLAALPDPQLPADVERRIVAAVSADAAAGADAGTTAPAATVGPVESLPGPAGAPPVPVSSLLPRHEAPSRPAWRRPWLMQSAAVLVIVALIGGVVVGLTRGGGGDPSQPAQLVLGQATAGPVNASGFAYTSAGLSTQVRDLVKDSTAAPAAEGDAAAGSAEDEQSTSQSVEPESSSSLGFSSGGGGAASALDKVTSLVLTPASRQACIDQLASVPGAQAVTIDVGTFDGKPAAVIVLPDEEDPTKVAAWVVGPTCSSADNPFPYRYERVTRP